MSPSEKTKFISNWIKSYVNQMPVKAQSLVIGISGECNTTNVTFSNSITSITCTDTDPCGNKDITSCCNGYDCNIYCEVFFN